MMAQSFLKRGFSRHGTASPAVTEASHQPAPVTPRTSVLGRIDLPNGQFIPTVRKDVMDYALKHGEFKKK